MLRPSCSISAVVLAAGQSTRMEEANKLVLPWGEGTILDAVLSLLAHAGMAEIVVVTGHEAEAIEPVLHRHRTRAVHNPDYRKGMASSIAVGVQATSPETTGILLALADMPAIRSSTVKRLVASSHDDGGIVVPVYEGRRGHPVIFHNVYRDELQALEGDRGARPLLVQHQAQVVEVVVDDDGVLQDVDTDGTYRAMRPRTQTEK